MSNYVKSTNFTSKDSLAVGNPLKIVKGSEIDTEFNNIATAVATKADSTGATLTSPTITTPTITGATITGGSVSSLTTDVAVADGGTGASTASGARTNLSAAASGANSDITSLSGLTTALSVAQGGTGANTLTANSVLVGNGTSAVQSVAPGTSGNVLTSNGTSWTSTAPQTIAVGANSVVSGNTFTVTTGSTGKCLITLHGKASSYFGGFGERTIGIQISGSLVASTVIRTIEWDGRLTNIGASVTYLYSGSANSNITVTYYSSGSGNAGDGYYSFIGT